MKSPCKLSCKRNEGLLNACHTCQKRANFSFLRANVPINVPTCQHGKGVPIFQLGVLMCRKACPFFNFACQTVCQVFNYFSKELCFFIYLINLYLIYFIYFVYFKYITSYIFFILIFFLIQLYHCV